MQPKEKALELVTIYYSQLSGVPKALVGSLPLSDDSYWKEAVQCALISVQNSINLLNEIDCEFMKTQYNISSSRYVSKKLIELLDVKTKIEKL